MEKEKLTDIFDITSKWREEHPQEGERTGLDLHMVKQLVEKMQGRIKVWSLEGKGSLFTVEIPQEIVERSFAETENRQETPEKKEWIEQKVGMAYCGEDEKMYREVLQAYCQQGKKYCQEIPDLLDREDWKNYGIAVHAIKSTSMTIGAVFLSEKAKQQEVAAKENRREDVMKGQEEFFQTYQCVLREAEKMLKTWEEESRDAQRNSLKSAEKENSELIQEGEHSEISQEKEPVSKEPAGGRKFSEDYLGECRILLDYVRNYEMSEALEQAEKLLEMEPVEMPRQVQAFVNDFEYEQAEKYLLEWIEEQECIR